MFLDHANSRNLMVELTELVGTFFMSTACIYECLGLHHYSQKNLTIVKVCDLDANLGQMHFFIKA
jgi:hypothetical protein